MNWKTELKKFYRFLLLAIFTAIALMALAAIVSWLLGWRTWSQFGLALSFGGGVALVVGLYSLIGGVGSFENLNRALRGAGRKDTAPRRLPKQRDVTFFLLMLFAGSIAVGLGRWLQKLG